MNTTTNRQTDIQTFSTTRNITNTRQERSDGLVKRETLSKCSRVYLSWRMASLSRVIKTSLFNNINNGTTLLFTEGLAVIKPLLFTPGGGRTVKCYWTSNCLFLGWFFDYWRKRHLTFCLSGLVEGQVFCVQPKRKLIAKPSHTHTNTHRNQHTYTQNHWLCISGFL